MMNYEPIEVAVALSLYAYNVPDVDRANKLYLHFKGDSAEPTDLVDILNTRKGHEATELAYPTAKLYVQHALERYGKEARERCLANENGNVDFLRRFGLAGEDDA